MKILLITATYYPSANGVAIAVKNLFEELKRQGHEVYLIAPNGTTKSKDPAGLVRYTSISNPIIKDYPIGLLPLNQQIFKLLNENKFDIVHAHHPFQVSFMADIISLFNRAPFVFTYHTYINKYIKMYLNFLPTSLVKIIAVYTGSSVLKKADLIIVPSNSVKNSVKKLDARGEIVVIPTGIPKFDKPSLSKIELKKKYRLPQEKTILLMVSRVAKEKNIRLLLKTMKIMPDKYFLAIVGMGPQTDELKKLARDNGVASRVKFLGKIDYSKISDVYSFSDIFVFSSVTETQGVVFLEAASFGIPIVAVDSIVNKEWVKPDFGLITKNNPRSFREAILVVDKNHDQYAKNAKSFAEKYSIERTTKELVKAYEKAIKNWKPRSPFDFDLKEKLKSISAYMEKMITS